MKVRTALLFLILLFISSIGATTAMNEIDCLKVGDMALGFSPDNGFSLDYRGASIIKESSLRVMKPGWIAIYYSYEKGEKDVQIRDIPGGREAVVHHVTPDFTGEHRITMLPDRITFDLTYKLLKDVDDAGVEYCLGYISSPVIVGRSFSTGSESGTVPLKPLSTGWDGFVTKNTFKRIVLDSRVGKITFETNGDPDELTLVDYRGMQVTWAEKSPIFSIAAPRRLLKTGEEHHSVVTISFIPPAPKKRPVVDVKEVKAPVREVADLHKTSPAPVMIIPEPKEMKLSQGDFVIGKDTQIVVRDGSTDEDLRGAREFAAELKELYGIEVPIVREKEALGKSLIIVGEESTNRKLRSAAIKAPPKEEGYSIKVTPDVVIILGNDKRGSYYGMQTLKQLVKASYDAVSIQGCEITDWPSLAFRGIHIYTGNQALPFHKKLIDRILSRFKMNRMIVECDEIQWKSVPEIAPHYAMSQEDVKKDVQYAREHFIEAFPQVSSLGHMHWMFAKKQHLDLAEDPSHPYAYCPSKQGSYDFIFKLYDEAIELFDHPEYFHIGHDEVTSVEAKFPCCPECKKKSVGDLFIEDTRRVYDHLKAKGVEHVMMWGDMLLAPGESPDACNMPDKVEAERLRSMLPRDVIVTDWHYAIEGPETYGSLKCFQDLGIKCVASTWYTPINIQNFSQAAKNNGSFGLLQTTWAGFNSCEQNLVDQKDQFTAYVLAAEYAWNSGKTPLEKLPYRAEDAFFGQWNRKPKERVCLKGFTVDLSSLCNAKLANTPDEKSWVGFHPACDLSKAPTGTTRIKDNLYTLAKDTRKASALRLASALDCEKSYPKELSIAIGKKVASLFFLHTCAWADTPGMLVGSYIVNYQDGTSEDIPLVYRKNIAAWSDKGPCSDAPVAWGSEMEGQHVSLRGLIWKNPHPDKLVKSVTLSSASTNAGPMVVGISGTL